MIYVLNISCDVLVLLALSIATRGCSYNLLIYVAAVSTVLSLFVNVFGLLISQGVIK